MGKVEQLDRLFEELVAEDLGAAMIWATATFLGVTVAATEIQSGRPCAHQIFIDNGPDGRDITIHEEKQHGTHPVPGSVH